MARMSDETELHVLIDNRVRAVRAKDLEGVLSSYAEDVVTFDLLSPLQNRGKPAVRKRLQEWFGSFETAIDYDLAQITLVVAGDIAFDHHFTHVHGTNKQGQIVEMWFRETLGYRKVEAHRWLCIHQHSSAPLDMKTMKGDLSLKP